MDRSITAALAAVAITLFVSFITPKLLPLHQPLESRSLTSWYAHSHIGHAGLRQCAAAQSADQQQVEYGVYMAVGGAAGHGYERLRRRRRRGGCVLRSGVWITLLSLDYGHTAYDDTRCKR